MIQEMMQLVGRTIRLPRTREVSVFTLCAIATVCSAVVLKRGGLGPALVAVEPVGGAVSVEGGEAIEFIAASVDVLGGEGEVAPVEAPALGGDEMRSGRWVEDGVEYFRPEAGHVRYYDGRPIRPVRTVWMVTTAYSPDHRSCGKWADGKTASMKSVWTNAMRSVAADTSLLPFGTLLSVPGYADDGVVPVLDRGGAIKGARLDLLYPTHQIAREWGVQRVPVTIWEYADEDEG